MKEKKGACIGSCIEPSCTGKNSDVNPVAVEKRKRKGLAFLRAGMARREESRIGG